MRYANVLGVDVGLTGDPTAIALLRVWREPFVIRGHELLDPATEEPIELPNGVTAAELAQPRFDVRDVQARTNLSFHQVARECRAIHDDHQGDLLVAVDATGLGAGAAEQVRLAGCNTLAVTFTNGSNVTSGRWRMNLPTGAMFSDLYAALVQNRLRIAEPVSERLARELSQVERGVTEAGHETYTVPRTGGGHGDTVYALGLAVVAGGCQYTREIRGLLIAGQQETGERPRGRRRSQPGGTAQRVIEQRRRERERDWYDQAGPTWMALGLGAPPWDGRR